MIPIIYKAMRYAPEHKDETKTRVLKEAAAALRQHGPAGVSVADIMRRAGLTHGGFYAHFATKDDLVGQAVTEMFDQGKRRFARMTAALPPAQAISAYIDAYVSQDHRDHPERGCPITSLAGDLSRAGGAVRNAFDAGVASMVARFAAWLPAPEETRARRAAALVAQMAGTVALARAVHDAAAAANILEAGRAAARHQAGLQ
jgi:TetR/AcrR family transcriptional repressor of nem operon